VSLSLVMNKSMILSLFEERLWNLEVGYGDLLEGFSNC